MLVDTPELDWTKGTRWVNKNSSYFRMRFGPQASNNKTLDDEATYEYPRLIWTSYGKQDTIRRCPHLHLLWGEQYGLVIQPREQISWSSLALALYQRLSFSNLRDSTRLLRFPETSFRPSLLKFVLHFTIFLAFEKTIELKEIIVYFLWMYWLLLPPANLFHGRSNMLIGNGDIIFVCIKDRAFLQTQSKFRNINSCYCNYPIAFGVTKALAYFHIWITSPSLHGE